MKLPRFVRLVLLALAGTAMASVPYPAWTYAQTDEEWAALRASDGSRPFAACSGPRQSPVDLVNVVSDATLRPLAPAWAPFRSFAVRHLGSTIEVDPTASTAPTFTDPNTGRTYHLLQFHFHSPSEHAWSGGYRDLEAHLVHQSTDGSLLVIAVSFVASAYSTNAFLNQFWKNIVGLAKGGRVLRQVPLNFTDALPVNPTYTTYPGSLTTPPCSPIVTWYVMDEAITLSSDQLAAFRQTVGFTDSDPAAFLANGNSRRLQRVAGRSLRRYVEGGEIAPLDKNVFSTRAGRVSVAALVIAVVVLVAAFATVTLYIILPMLQRPQRSPGEKTLPRPQVMREKGQLVSATVV